MVLRLSDIAPGQSVEFVGFDSALDPALRDRLLAYGLAPTQPLTVLQQKPLTIVVCDHAELALETPVARAMRVLPGPCSDRTPQAARKCLRAQSRLR